MARAKRQYNPNPPVDRELLHKYLWEHSHPASRRVEINQSEWAETLNVTRGTVLRIVKEFVADGRIRPVVTNQHNTKVYVVTDPMVMSGEKQAQPRRIAWG